MAAQIIMVASGKGGTGKSTVSVLLGSRLAAAGKKVLLIELDSGLRSVDIIAGAAGRTVYDLSLIHICPADDPAGGPGHLRAGRHAGRHPPGRGGLRLHRPPVSGGKGENDP